MYHTGHTLEKPIMRAVPNHEDTRRDPNVLRPKTTPALRNNGSDSRQVNSIKDESRQGVGVVDNDRAEPDINRWRSGFQERCEFGFWRV